MSKFIYDFVHSMTMREKVYFKCFANTFSDKKDSNYMRLYDAIVEMPVFEKNALKNRFVDDSISKYLSSELNYLFGQLLKGLANYHFDSTPQHKLQKSIIYIDILISKGFRKRALKLLVKAKKLAYHYEDFTVILKLIQYEEDILFTEGILGFTDKLSELQNERLKVNKQIINLSELRLLREQVRELQFNVGYITNTKEHPQIFEIPIMESEANALSIKAKEHWYYIYEFRYYITRRNKEGLDASNRYLEFMEANNHLIKNSRILSTISNNLLFASLLSDKASFYRTLPKLERLENDAKLDQVYIQYIKYTRLMKLYYLLGDVDETSKLFDVVGEFTKANHQQMGVTQVNYILLLVVRSGIMTKRFEDAIDWMNLWNKLGSLDYTLVLARLFSIIIHMELGWNDLLQYEVKTTYKVLRNHKKYGELPKVFLDFSKNYLSSIGKMNELVKEMKPKLEKIRLDPTENHAFEHFDFVNWCEEKLKN